MEEWRPVPGYEGRYEVSSMGQVRSLPHRVRVGHGALRMSPGKLLRPGVATQSGHLSVCLGRGNKQHVHTLVLVAFRGKCPPNHEGRHLDGNSANNWLDNLEWALKARNSQDKKHHRLPNNAVVTPAIARSIKLALKTSTLQRSIAKAHGVSESVVSQIKHGRTHKDIL